MEVRPLKIVTPSSGKVLVIVLIAVVIVLALAAGAAWYFQKDAVRQQPEPQPVVSRHKIPSAPVPPAPLAPAAEPEEDALAVQPPAADTETQAAAQADLNAASTDSVEIRQPDEALPVIARDEAQALPEAEAPTSNEAAEEASQKPSVEPAVATPGAADSQPPEEKPFYAIQVGAYRSQDNANHSVADLQKKGYEAFILEAGAAKAQTLYTVCIGHYDSKAQAQAPLSEFRHKEKKSAFIIHSDR